MSATPVQQVFWLSLHRLPHRYSSRGHRARRLSWITTRICWRQPSERGKTSLFLPSVGPLTIYCDDKSVRKRKMSVLRRLGKIDDAVNCTPTSRDSSNSQTSIRRSMWPMQHYSPSKIHVPCDAMDGRLSAIVGFSE
jgi:hypothetical protein